MQILFLILILVVWFFFGYKFYGSFVEKKLNLDYKKITPAVHKNDGVDYSPSIKPFLFGHHFASITGAGPIIGPILAVGYFGWAAVILWLALGSVFIGAMHDYISLIASIRHGGQGISSIAKSTLNPKIAWLFGFVIWLTLVLIITVFSVSSAESIISKPELVLPLVSITTISMIVGYGVEKLNWNYKIATILGLILIFCFVWLGHNFPISIPIENEFLLRLVCISIVIGYAAISSLLPVWFLLRPRDYLSSIQMVIILLLGFVSLIFVNPEINAPVYISGNFPIWPILFITVACGAVSGFHGLVASGTTSKQLACKKDAKSIGYGGMILESGVAVFVVLLVISGLKWNLGSESYFKLLEKGWIFVFGKSFGSIVGKVGLPFLSSALASLIGSFMVNEFIFTSLDTSARLGRMILSEHLLSSLKNKALTSFVTLFFAWILAVTNSYKTIWKLFGAANQLIAALTLFVVAAFFIQKKIQINFIVIPAIFVSLTTLAGILYLNFNKNGYIASNNYILVVVSLCLFLLGLVIIFDSVRKKLKFI